MMVAKKGNRIDALRKVMANSECIEFERERARKECLWDLFCLPLKRECVDAMLVQWLFNDDKKLIWLNQIIVSHLKIFCCHAANIIQ